MSIEVLDALLENGRSMRRRDRQPRSGATNGDAFEITVADCGPAIASVDLRPVRAYVLTFGPGAIDQPEVANPWLIAADEEDERRQLTRIADGL